MNTKRQYLLKLLRKQYCDDKTSTLAKRIGRDYSYVHRLLLSPDKKGHKGIGLEIMQACTDAFGLYPGFWEGGEENEATKPPPDAPLLPAPPSTPTAREPDAAYTVRPAEDLAPTSSPYARLLANTFDALGMAPDEAKLAFVAATQALIDHSSACSDAATAAPAGAANPSSKLPLRRGAATKHT